MIATVLLIAFTVVIGGIVSLWLSTLTTTTTGTVGTQTSNQTKCAGAYIKVDRVASSLIIYSNPTIESITNITAISSEGITVIVTNSTLGPSQTGSAPIGRAGNTSFIFKGLCRGTPIEGSCASTDACWV